MKVNSNADVYTENLPPSNLPLAASLAYFGMEMASLNGKPV